MLYVQVNNNSVLFVSDYALQPSKQYSFLYVSGDTLRPSQQYFSFICLCWCLTSKPTIFQFYLLVVMLYVEVNNISALFVSSDAVRPSQQKFSFIC